jgi:formate--tetrahydrofolate ligase
VKAYAKAHGAEAILCKHWAKGSAGIEELARGWRRSPKAGVSDFRRSIPTRWGSSTRSRRSPRGSTAAGEVVADGKIRDQLKEWEAQGYGHLPVCMAKTQYSFTTDPNLRGAPDGHSVPVREVRLSAGAGFVVAICGEIMTMPGLPKVPAAETIRLNEAAETVLIRLNAAGEVDRRTLF